MIKSSTMKLSHENVTTSHQIYKLIERIVIVLVTNPHLFECEIFKERLETKMGRNLYQPKGSKDAIWTMNFTNK